MFDALTLRDEPPPDLLVVVRLGVHTMQDEHLARSAAECHDRWGLQGFSVLEVPGGDFAELARMRPVVAARRRLHVARGADLLTAGFPPLPTMDAPRWTVALSAPTSSVFASVRVHFDGDGEPLGALVLARTGDRVTVRIQMGTTDAAAAI